MEYNIEPTKHILRVIDEREEQSSYCYLCIHQYNLRLEHLYKNRILTEEQCAKEREKLNDMPSDLEERLKYLNHILENLQEIYLKSIQS